MEIAIAIIVVASALGGVYLGHWFTLKSIAHVQPSTQDTIKMNLAMLEDEDDDPYKPNDGDMGEAQRQNAPESVNEYINRIKQKYGKNPEDMYGLPGSS